MDAIRTGNATPEKRKDRAVLSPRGPFIETALASIQFDDYDIDGTRRFGNALLAARDTWADANRNGRRYSDKETARFRNSLAAARKGGAL